MRSLFINTTAQFLAPDSKGAALSLPKAPGKKTNGNGKPATDKDAATFTLQMFEDWTPEGVDEKKGYKAGEFISKPAHIAEWIRAVIMNGDNEELSQRIKETKDADIISLAKQTKFEADMSVEDKLSAIVAKVSESRVLSAVSDENVPTADHLARVRANRGSSQAMAQTMGEKVNKETTQLIEEGLAALRTADACAPRVAFALLSQFTQDERNNVPPVGSRYRPNQARGKSVAPWGYRAPDQFGVKQIVGTEDLPVYNGPWDLGETHNTSGAGKEWPTTSWCEDFTACTPDGRPWFVKVECLRKIAAGKDIPTEVDGNRVSAELMAELMTLKQTGDENQWKDALGEASWEFNKRQTWYSKGWQVIQAIEYIESRFPAVTVQLYELNEKGIALEDATKEQLEHATRKRRPFRLVTTRKVTRKDGTQVEKDIGHMALPMSKLITIAKGAHKMARNAEGGLVQTIKNTRPKTNTEAAKADTTHAQGIDGEGVKTIGGFQKVAYNVVNYLDDEDNFTGLLHKARTDGAFASVIVRIARGLNTVTAEKAVQIIAMKFEQDAANEMAAAETPKKTEEKAA